MEYTLLDSAVEHTCWNDPGWSGTLESDRCEGCKQAEQYPCEWCGYGHVFTTHNDVAHAENGDLQVPMRPTLEWHNSPHLYGKDI